MKEVPNWQGDDWRVTAQCTLSLRTTGHAQPPRKLGGYWCILCISLCFPRHFRPAHAQLPRSFAARRSAPSECAPALSLLAPLVFLHIQPARFDEKEHNHQPPIHHLIPSPAMCSWSWPPRACYSFPPETWIGARTLGSVAIEGEEDGAVTSIYN